MNTYSKNILIGLIAFFLTIFMNSMLEWFVHGPMMHGRFGKFFSLRKNHVEHHQWFGKGEGFSNEKHGQSVALPHWAFLFTVGPLALIGWILGAVLGLSFLVHLVTLTSAFYYIAYQYVHTTLHIPSARRLKDARWFKKKNVYHQKHHFSDERFDKFTNICILCDWADHVMGTSSDSKSNFLSR